MAGVQWTGEHAKVKSATEAKALFFHDCKDTREKHGHSNDDIDVTKTPLNFSLRGLSYEQLCRSYDSAMQKLEGSYRKSKGKNATTLMQSLIIYAPRSMTDEATIRDWYQSVGRILLDLWGDNVLEMNVHFDEQHPYYDPVKGEEVMSRVHGHVNVIPVVDGKLNCKQFSSRANMVMLNNLLEDMSVREYGVHYVTGEGSKHRKKSMTQLKAESEAYAEGFRAGYAKAMAEVQAQQKPKQVEQTPRPPEKPKAKPVDRAAFLAGLHADNDRVFGKPKVGTSTERIQRIWGTGKKYIPSGFEDAFNAAEGRDGPDGPGL